jgi:hypothetical protein
MAKIIEDQLTPPNTGRDLLLSSLRRVLLRRGYTGAELEKKIQELQQRDFPRLTAALATWRRPKHHGLPRRS